MVSLGVHLFVRRTAMVEVVCSNFAITSQQNNERTPCSIVFSLRQKLLRVHVGFLHGVADPVVWLADDQQPLLTVDQHAASPPQNALPAAFDVLPGEYDLVVRAHEHRDQCQRPSEYQPVSEQRQGRVHERGRHVYPPLDVFRQVTDTLV